MFFIYVFEDEAQLETVREPWEDTLKIDELLHSPIRFSILVFLMSRGQARYREVQKALNLTAGNLTTHLKKLKEVDLVIIEKMFVDAKPTTIVILTEKGRTAVRDYSKNLYGILEKIIDEGEDQVLD